MSMLALLCLATPALTGPIDLVDYFGLSGNTVVNFQEFPAGFPGTNVDGVVSSPGVSFAERFAGQILSEGAPTTPGSGPFDVLSANPTGPLSLEVGLPNQNLSVASDVILVDDRFLSGNGPIGFPNSLGLGEGAVAMRFSALQFELGMRIFGGNSATATVDFFRADGSRIETLVLAGLPFDSRFGFRREGNVADIAGISIYNDDPGGVGFTEIRIQQVPEPSALYLFSTGLLGFVTWLRRRAHE